MHNFKAKTLRIIPFCINKQNYTKTKPVLCATQYRLLVFLSIYPCSCELLTNCSAPTSRNNTLCTTIKVQGTTSNFCLLRIFFPCIIQRLSCPIILVRRSYWQHERCPCADLEKRSCLLLAVANPDPDYTFRGCTCWLQKIHEPYITC